MLKYKNKEEFIERSIELFGDIFDFSDSEYTNVSNNIEYKCKEGNHLIKRTPANHLKKGSCPLCNKRIKDKDDFVKESKRVHGNKFNYDHVEYVNQNIKVKLVCNDCGEIIFQKPVNNINGKGCWKCGKRKPIDGKEFLEKVDKTHNGFYTYDIKEIETLDSDTVLNIMCPLHGKFKQKVTDHIRHGCTACGRIKTIESHKKTQEQFIEEVKKIHGDKFNYSKIEYMNSSTKVLLICNKCSREFYKNTSDLLNGSGCPYCVGKNKNTEIFIEEVKKIYGDLYDYSEVEYKGDRVKVKVICPQHGPFMITPNNFKRNRKCKKCSASFGEIKISLFLDKYEIPYKKEFTFSDCIDKRPLRFDFAVFDEKDNIVCLIEFQGAQHFFPVNFTGKMSEETINKNFELAQKRDSIKREYCSKNNIKLLEISYKDFEKIDEILSSNFPCTLKLKEVEF